MRRIGLRHYLLISLALLSSGRFAVVVNAEPPVPSTQARPARPRFYEAFFERLGLSEEQTKQVLAIDADFRSKLDQFDAQRRKLWHEESRAYESVLTEDQRAQLLQLREELRSKVRHRKPSPPAKPPNP